MQITYFSNHREDKNHSPRAFLYLHQLSTFHNNLTYTGTLWPSLAPHGAINSERENDRIFTTKGAKYTMSREEY